MQTIIIVLDSRKMQNPDLDIRYILPDRIDEYTNGRASDNGYDYISDDELAVWLSTEDAERDVKDVIELIKTEKFLDNDLTRCAQVYISDKDCAELENSRKVF